MSSKTKKYMLGNPTGEHLECIRVNQWTNWSSDPTTTSLRRWKVSRLIFLRPSQQKLPFSSPTDQNIKALVSSPWNAKCQLLWNDEMWNIKIFKIMFSFIQNVEIFRVLLGSLFWSLEAKIQNVKWQPFCQKFWMMFSFILQNGGPKSKFFLAQMGN